MMNDEPTVWDLGELDEFFVWRSAEHPETLFLDVFRFLGDEQVTHRYKLRADRAKELLRLIAIQVADGDTLEIPPDGPARSQ